MKKETLPSTVLARTEGTKGSDSQDGVRRRSFLKGLGMTGVALSAGALFAGEAKAQTNQSPNRLTPGDAAILPFLAAAAQAKMTQKQVSYQDTPKGTQQCDKCKLFQPPSACKSVEGEISPKGWCNIFQPKG